jgi:hypothetical protein
MHGMAAHGGTTTDHRVIRRWAEARGAQPSRVARTGAAEAEGDPGIIRLDLPGYPDAGASEPITWEAWFRAFDEHALAFVYQDTTVDGGPSNVGRLVKRAGATEPAVEKPAADGPTAERMAAAKRARRGR